MIDSLTLENYRDFGARYAGTYGWYLHNESKKFVFVTRVEDNKVFFKDIGGMEFYGERDSDTKFDFIPVKNGWFNAADGRSYLLSRKPARQWKRGISQNNTTAFSLDKEASTPLTFALLNSIFNTDFDKFNNKLDFSPGALSKFFALSNNYKLFFYQLHVGDYNPEVNQINLFTPLIQQELKDLIRDKRWNIKLEVLNEDD